MTLSTRCRDHKWRHLPINWLFILTIALFGIIFVRYGNWFSRLEQVENAPKFPRPWEGGNQFANGFQNLTNQLQFSSCSYKHIYFWHFSFSNEKWFRTLLISRLPFQNMSIKTGNQNLKLYFLTNAIGNKRRVWSCIYSTIYLHRYIKYEGIFRTTTKLVLKKLTRIGRFIEIITIHVFYTYSSNYLLFPK